MLQKPLCNSLHNCLQHRTRSCCVLPTVLCIQPRLSQVVLGCGPWFFVPKWSLFLTPTPNSAHGLHMGVKTTSVAKVLQVPQCTVEEAIYTALGLCYLGPVATALKTTQRKGCTTGTRSISVHSLRVVLQLTQDRWSIFKGHQRKRKWACGEYKGECCNLTPVWGLCVCVFSWQCYIVAQRGLSSENLDWYLFAWHILLALAQAISGLRISMPSWAMAQHRLWGDRCLPAPASSVFTFLLKRSEVCSPVRPAPYPPLTWNGAFLSSASLSAKGKKMEHFRHESKSWSYCILWSAGLPDFWAALPDSCPDQVDGMYLGRLT